MTRTVTTWIAVVVGCAVAGAAGAQQPQGVTKDEIVIGTIQDLSGPLADYCKRVRDAMRMRVDEINAGGGINGRKLRLVVEDHGYDPKKAVLAAKKLVQLDKVFLSTGTIGTSTSLATVPTFLEQGLPHVFPLALSHKTFEPLNPLTFAFAVPYFEQTKVVIKAFNATRADRKWCLLYQDDDYGAEVRQAAEEGMKAAKKSLAVSTSYKRGATDFSSQVAKMKGAGCDTVILATTNRETVGVMAEAKKVGLAAEFAGTSPTYSDLIPKLGGAAVNGYTASFVVGQPYPDDPTPGVREWVKRYRARFTDEPDAFAAMGYLIIAWTEIGLRNAGPNLTGKTFAEALERSKFPRDLLGLDSLNIEMTFSPTKHLGSYAARLARITDGKWVTISDFIQP